LATQLQDISRDPRVLWSLGSADEINQYIQQTLHSHLIDILAISPVGNAEQEALRRDVEFYTFAEQLLNANNAINNT
jgi:hypothetical protein